MSSNIVFRCKTSDDFKIFKKEVSDEFDIEDKETKESFVSNRFILTGLKITITYYMSGKVMIQGSPDIAEIEKLVNIAKRRFKFDTPRLFKKSIKDISEINKKYFIGLDESGVGETFGCMYLGIAIIKKEDLLEAHKIFRPQDVKQFDVKTVIDLNIKSNKFFEKNLKRYNARDIDTSNKILLLDRGYEELLLKYKNLIPDSCIILDDYGIGTVFKNFIKKWEKAGAIFILRHKADSIYLPPMAASIIARKSRNTEIKTLTSKYSIIDPKTGEKIELTTGSPSNPLTEKWLIAYRRANPYSDFPFFVRNKWKNVQEIEKRFPKKSISHVFSCQKCGNGLGKVYIRYDKIKDSTEIQCPTCGEQVNPIFFKKNFSYGTIVMDTSSLITRIVSKDLRTTKIFENMKFIIPSCVYEEIDTKQPDKKKGAENEISFLKECQTKGIIELEDVDVDILSGLSKDKKIIEVARQHKASLITYDRTQNLWSSIRSFVFYIVN